MANVTTVFTTMGATIFQKNPNSDTPATVEASFSSRGICSMFCRNRKMPKVEARPGRIKP